MTSYRPTSLPGLQARRTFASLSAVLALAGCATGAGTSAASDAVTQAEWRALRAARPEPLEGAPRVTIGEVDLLGVYPWHGTGAVSAGLGIAELAVAGLLRRRDIDFVERRKFSSAAEAERAGRPRRPGQPAAGVSPSAEFSAIAVWIPMGSDDAAMEVRLSTLETGDIAGATRVRVAGDADPVTLGRALVEGILEVTRDLGRLPQWQDPLATSTESVNATGVARVENDALQNFLRGLAAEEEWNWEGARRGYQAAAADPGFYEARTALARTARLRLGGTLAES